MMIASSLLGHASGFSIPLGVGLAERLPAPRSLSRDPLADIYGASLQRRARRFALCEEAHRIVVDELDLAEVEDDGTLSFFGVEQASDLREVLRFDAPAQHEPYAVILHRPLDPQHQDPRALQAGPLVRSRITRRLSRRAIHRGL